MLYLQFIFSLFLLGSSSVWKLNVTVLPIYLISQLLLLNFLLLNIPSSQLQSQVPTGIHRLITTKQYHNFLTYSYISYVLSCISIVCFIVTSNSTCPELNTSFCNLYCVPYLIFDANKHPTNQARKPRDKDSFLTNLQIMTKTCWFYLLYECTCVPFTQSLLPFPLKLCVFFLFPGLF